MPRTITRPSPCAPAMENALIAAMKPLPACLLALSCFAVTVASSAQEAGKQWYRGNTHTHSLWSDGNDFPEMIVGWYAERGYDFIALSDHDILATGEKWVSDSLIKKRQRAIGTSAVEKYRKHFANQPEWIETREDKTGETEFRLKRIDEYRPLFEKPGEFLVVQAEEISNQSKGKPVHMNAINMPGTTAVPPVKNDDDVQTIMRKTLAAVAEVEKQTGTPILTHLNHPNFQWAVTAEDLANVVEERYFEVYNGHPGINHLGREGTPGDEQIWDIVNTIRIAELDSAPVFGVATDDSHTYHGGDVRPGRDWVMVHAEKLEADALVLAMRAGDFYASSGVSVESIHYDKATRKLTLKINGSGDAKFTTQLIGTRKGYDAAAADGKTGIGEIFETATGTEVEFTLPADALYARATITSDQRHDDPSFDGQKKQAWLQPVGWR